MSKKNLITEALIEAKELEAASIENAKNIILESFAPDFATFFKGVLNEGEDFDEEDFDDEEDELEEGNEHDIGKEPDNGRQGADPAVDDDIENLPMDKKNMEEGKYDDVSGDATPEKGQAGLPNKPNVKKVGKDGWEDEGSSGKGMPTSRESQSGTPSTKQVGDDGWEDEGYAGKSMPTSRESLKNTPSPKVVSEEDDFDDEEIFTEEDDFEVPDDLFDDDEGEGSEVEDIDDEDIDIDIEDDEDDVANESDEIEYEDDEMSDDEYEEEDADDEVNENLYFNRKMAPKGYLRRIESLNEAIAKRDRAIAMLRSQLQETHLFNAKMAHLNKLTMTGQFTTSEKKDIAERLDECESVDEVKSLYRTVVRETQSRNPLDTFSDTIKEQRLSRGTKTEKIYESADVKRMRALIDYRFDD